MPVTFVSLSMGGPYFVSFLNNFVDQTWKVIPIYALFFLLFSIINIWERKQDTYVRAFHSWDGAFGGSTGALLAALRQILSGKEIRCFCPLEGSLGIWYEASLQHYQVCLLSSIKKKKTWITNYNMCVSS